MISRKIIFAFTQCRLRDFYIAAPEGHPLTQQAYVEPREVVHIPQVVFNYDVGNSFKEWTTGTPADEKVVCTVDTVQSALDLVAAGVGVAFIPDTCVQDFPGVQFIPLRNWHQALYMCILYDKWLEPPVWDFVELLVNSIRKEAKEQS